MKILECILDWIIFATKVAMAYILPRLIYGKKRYMYNKVGCATRIGSYVLIKIWLEAMLPYALFFAKTYILSILAFLSFPLFCMIWAIIVRSEPVNEEAYFSAASLWQPVKKYTNLSDVEAALQKVQEIHKQAVQDADEVTLQDVEEMYQLGKITYKQRGKYIGAVKSLHKTIVRSAERIPELRQRRAELMNN